MLSQGVQITPATNIAFPRKSVGLARGLIAKEKGEAKRPRPLDPCLALLCHAHRHGVFVNRRQEGKSANRVFLGLLSGARSNCQCYMATMSKTRDDYLAMRRWYEPDRDRINLVIIAESPRSPACIFMIPKVFRASRCSPHCAAAWPFPRHQA